VVFKESPDKAAVQIRLSLNLIRIYAIISAPFIPDASNKILESLHTDDRSWPTNLRVSLSTLNAGHIFTVPEVLFAKISDESRKEWEKKFGGVID
jgi:methionyl-tRNA synthetase